MRKPAALLVLALALAGCSGGGSDSGPGDPTGGSPASHGAHGADDPATHIVAPNWTVGQWWTLSSDQAAAPFTHVVSADGGADWTVDTDSQDIAFFDARFDISFLGKVRKADLAGSQGNERVKFFDFPLTEGKNWTTKWDGLEMKVRAVSVAGGVAKLEARLANGTLYADYTYDAAKGYFRDYAFYGPDGATVGFAAKLTASGTGFSGDLVRWSLEVPFETHAFAPGLLTFDVGGPGLTDVYIEVGFTCSQGAFSIAIGPPTGPAENRGYAASGPCPQTLSDASTLPVPAAVERWGASLAPPPGDPAGAMDITVFERTLATFKAGSPPA